MFYKALEVFKFLYISCYLHHWNIKHICLWY